MILLDNVTKFYPGDSHPALDHVSLHIEPNEFAFLVGKSGAGKSTLMKMITKEETPDKGKIIIGGIDLDYVKKRYIPHYRRRLGVVFQDFKLLPGRTVYENVAFALEIAGMSNTEIEKTVPKVLDLVGLAGKEKKFPRHLSGGEQQRVSIARSVARQPKILIADEPTGNLDKLTRGEIIDLLQKINDFGTTVLVTTHDENIVNNLQKRVITLKDGQIVSDQKNGGVYRLDKVVEKPVIEKQPLGRMFAPRAAAGQPEQLSQQPTPQKVARVTVAKSPALAPAMAAPRPTVKPRTTTSMIIDSSKLKPAEHPKAMPTKLRTAKSKVI
ncbi:cell division ATP-binding protein FtsE [Candidatus Saccharibacteria bacterium]|nr:cell division ATP-binding protein FtsE [Candidatus Saccharibacteria bacterium]